MQYLHFTLCLILLSVLMNGEILKERVTTVTLSREFSKENSLNQSSNKYIIDYGIIKYIESRGNPSAYNSRSGARGLYQITPICLADYNQHHFESYVVLDLFDPEINERVAHWYIATRIPEMLKHFGKPVTPRNILIAYNAGINYVVHPRALPGETVQYLQLYQELGGLL